MAPKSASKRTSNRIKRQAASEHPIRLQRLLASAGFGSRRQCEDLIETGRVEIDGSIVTQLGSVVDPKTQKVKVDGVLLKKQKLVYYAVNKPVGFVTTNRDPQGRPRVIDLVPPSERVFPVGRLDRSSEGLLLLTNDGELSQKLTHPKFGVRKVYRVTVAGKVDFESMKKMRQGIYIAEGFVKVEGAKLLKTRSRATEMEIILREGKNREIRRILARLGHKVQTLRRIAVGPLKLGDLPQGAYRLLSTQEVDKLWRSVEIAEQTAADSPMKKSVGAKKRGSKITARGQGGGRKKTEPSKSDGTKRIANPRGTRSTFLLGAKESNPVGTVIGGDSDTRERRQSKDQNRKNRSSDETRSTKRATNHQNKSSRGKSSRSGTPKGSTKRTPKQRRKS